MDHSLAMTRCQMSYLQRRYIVLAYSHTNLMLIYQHYSTRTKLNPFISSPLQWWHRKIAVHIICSKGLWALLHSSVTFPKWDSSLNTLCEAYSAIICAPTKTSIHLNFLKYPKGQWWILFPSDCWQLLDFHRAQLHNFHILNHWDIMDQHNGSSLS